MHIFTGQFVHVLPRTYCLENIAFKILSQKFHPGILPGNITQTYYSDILPRSYHLGINYLEILIRNIDPEYFSDILHENVASDILFLTSKNYPGNITPDKVPGESSPEKFPRTY